MPTRFMKTFTAFFCLVILPTASLGLAQTPSVDLRFSNDKVALVRTIASNADTFETAKACQRLAEIGDGQAVEPLSQLLDDAQLSNYARNALEGIPDPKALEALRDSLGRLQGDFLVGAIGSVGRLHDAAAIDELAKLSRNTDASVAEAAGRALARIGTVRSAEILQSVLQSSPRELQKAHALACLQCAQRLFQENEQASGKVMLDFLSKFDVAEEIKMAAAVQKILAGGVAGPSLLVEQVRSSDVSNFQAALQAIRQMDGDHDKLVLVLADELPKLPAVRQAALIRAIADLKSKIPMDSIQVLAKSGTLETKKEAIRLLAQQQNVGSIDLLFDAAASHEPDLANVSRKSLAHWPSDAIDKRILSMLTGSDAFQQAAAIELSGLRRLSKAGGLLVPIAKGPDATLQKLALEALGACGTLSEFPSLLALATDATETLARQSAREAIRIACTRLPQSCCAALLDEQIAKTTGDARIYLMDQLAAVGGSAALESIVKAAHSSDVELKDASTRLLGEWLTPDVAPRLMELSKSLTDDRYKSRAIRGYIRVARQLDVPLEERIEICRQTLILSNRPEETSLVLTVLKQYPSLSGLELTSSLLEKSTAREVICTTALAISQKLYEKHPNEVRKTISMILDKTKSPETIAACNTLLAELKSR